MAQPKTPQHPSATEFSTYLEYLSDSAQPLASQDPTAIQYSTYLDYLGDLINHGFNEYKPLHIYLSYIQSISSPSSRDEVDEYAISVLDLTQIGVRGVRKFRPTVGNSGRSKDFASFKQYIQENDQVMSRLIVLHPSTWFAERYSRGPKIITDSLGLGVGILPWFFHEFCREREERHHHRRPYTIKALPYLESTWVADCNFILLGTHWVLITGHPGTPRSVVLIPSTFKPMMGNEYGRVSSSKAPDTVPIPCIVQLQQPSGVPLGRIDVGNPLLSKIIACASSNGQFGDMDIFLFACIEPVISNFANYVPIGVPYFQDWNGPVRDRNSIGVARSGPPEAMWADLRRDLDDARRMLRELPDFMGRFFDTEKDEIKASLDRSTSKLRKYVLKVEPIETAFRDQLAIIGAAKGIAAAELSIQESKRTMLVTVLAFIFIPISLGTSIFGMNIQEINGSGHNIWVFAVTTIALLLAAGVLFFLSKVVVKFRKELIYRREVKVRDYGPCMRKEVVDWIFFVPAVPARK